MCGILFLFDEAANKTQMDSRSNHALQQLTHRGPDDEGLAVDENWRIGHKRLSIIDLSSSRQPMSDINQRFWLTYNGEIYNYKELRHGLESHWTFRSNGDTEVILAGLVHYGESFIERMEGMWAFALWDKEDKSLLLSRDRIGKKPLYYQETENFFSCSSEIPALRYLRKNSWAQDQDSLADYLRYGFYHPGTTIYKDVLEVLPGHNLLCSPGGKSKQTQ